MRVTVENRTPELLAKTEQKLNRWVRAAAALVESNVKARMAEPKSGRAYTRGRSVNNPGGFSVHVASAPGEAPAVDTGTLIGSIQMVQESTLTAKVGTAVEYALYLELGTSRMRPRPVWKPTVDDLLPTLNALLQSELSQLK
jgi:hypothetical protein